MLPLILMVPVPQDPTALWARVLSYVPPLVDYVATTALLAVTVAIALHAAARVFRRGLLAGAGDVAWAKNS